MYDDKEENLISHLEALRSTLIKCLIGYGVTLPFTFFVSPKILNFFIEVITKNTELTLNFFSPTEVFLIQIKLACMLNLIICFPYIAKKIWDFILPALYDNEKKFIQNIVFLSSFLFLTGVLFAIFVIIPFIMNFGMGFVTPNIKAFFGISNIINLTLTLCLAFGVMFQFPLVTHGLIKSRIVERKTIENARPYIIVGILVLSGILTPPDVLSQLIMFVPTYALFELGLLFSR